MEQVFTKEEKKLLQAKNPTDYINRSLDLDIPSGRKAYVTRHWLDKTGYSVEDIKYHRNRHPYWKEKKMKGSAERTALRFAEHDYSSNKVIMWDEKMLRKFIDNNKKDKLGKYIFKDWELAKKFKCTIATIQHLRRKYNMSTSYITNNIGKVTEKRLMEHLKLGEGTLRKMNKAKKKKR